MRNFNFGKIGINQKTKIGWYLYCIVGLLFILPIMVFNFSLAHGATNSDLNNLYNQRSELNKQIQQNEKAAQQKKKDAKELSAAIKQVDDGISQTESKINSTQDDIDNTQAVIEDLLGQIRKKEEELAKEENNKNNTIRAIYQVGEPSTMELLVRSETLAQLVNQSQYYEMLEVNIESTIIEISKLKTDLESKRTEFEGKQKALKQLKLEQEAYKKGLSDQKKEKEIVLSNTKTQQKKLEDQVAEAQKMSNQVEAEIAKIQAQMKDSTSRTVMARDRGTSTVGFSWPINYNYISAYYGGRTPFQSFHTGIDLVNIPGTPVHAVAGGTVVTVAEMITDGHYYGYGKYIVIGHNARYSSLYAHLMDYVVSPGDEVKEGDVIGYLGNTGWSTGPHLHLEIWEYGNRQNPINYLP